MKKRIWVLGIIGIMMTTIFSGCGQQEEKEVESTTQAEKTITKQDSQDVPKEEKEITVWAWDASFNGTALAEADKIYDGANINFVEMGKADCLKKIHTVLASGVNTDLPDIVLIGDLAAQGYLMSYPDAFKPMDDIINYEDFASYKKEAVSYEGIGYGVPFDTGVAGLFYRTDYMKEIGYTHEDMQNLTWEEYLEIGNKLKEKGHLLQTFNPTDLGEFQIMLQSAGTWFTDEDGNANFINNRALEESFKVFDALNKSDFCKVVSDWTEFAGAINGGDVACVLRGSWISSTIMAAEDQKGKWAVAPIPKLNVEGATNRSNQGGSSWYVLKNSENSEIAADFLSKTFGASTELYNTLLAEKNIVATYLPASTVQAYDLEQEFYGGQKVNAELAIWLKEIPAVNTGAFSAEAQAALTAIMPNYLAGEDLNRCLKEATVQFEQTIQ